MTNRRDEIRLVVEDAQARRARGEKVSVANLLHEHVALLPELEQALLQAIGPDTVPWVDDTPLDSCLGVHQIRALIAGHLPQSARGRAVCHLAQCVDCREEYEFHREMVEVVRDAERPPHVPGYENFRPLGRGGYGTVWVARHVEIKHDRAIKMLRADRFSPSAVAALRREAELLVGLPPHPNRVQVHDLISTLEGPALVLGYVRGGSLAARAPCPWPDALRYVVQAAAALTEVHAANLVHGDITPSNLLWDFDPLRGRDRAVVSDFGLAAKADAPGEPCGTPGYMAPEIFHQARSYPADIYGLTASLVGLLTGRSPPKAREQLDAVLTGLPVGLHTLIRSGLEPDPTVRLNLAGFQAMAKRVDTAALGEAIEQQLRQLARPVQLTVAVSAKGSSDPDFRPVLMCCNEAAAQAVRRPHLLVRPGELLRFDVSADAPGYLTVLNLDSERGTELLLPRPGKPAPLGPRPHRLVVQAQPSGSVETTAFIWTLTLGPTEAGEWRDKLLTYRGASAARALIPIWSGPAQSELTEDNWAALLIDLRQHTASATGRQSPPV